MFPINDIEDDDEWDKIIDTVRVATPEEFYAYFEPPKDLTKDGDVESDPGPVQLCGEN